MGAGDAVFPAHRRNDKPFLHKPFENRLLVVGNREVKQFKVRNEVDELGHFVRSDVRERDAGLKGSAGERVP